MPQSTLVASPIVFLYENCDYSVIVPLVPMPQVTGLCGGTRAHCPCTDQYLNLGRPWRWLQLPLPPDSL